MLGSSSSDNAFEYKEKNTIVMIIRQDKVRFLLIRYPPDILLICAIVCINLEKIKESLLPSFITYATVCIKVKKIKNFNVDLLILEFLFSILNIA